MANCYYCYFSLCIFALLVKFDCSLDISLPKLRNFVFFRHSDERKVNNQFVKQSIVGNFRILQFNMLADGLSGLRADLGAFSRAKEEDVQWETRKIKLLREILQYDPDVITLQECDHYYDFFLPALSVKGYDGIFAPKPASACLEVSENSDGCVIFLKREKFKIISAETITYAHSNSDIITENVKEEDRQVRPQNQVALIAVCKMLEQNLKTSSLLQQKGSTLIIATTHLKASKNAVGERIRFKEMQQLLAAIDSCRVAVSRRFGGLQPAVVLAGDLNACPTPLSPSMNGPYPSTVYPLIKQHPLGYRSVLNDDLLTHLTTSGSSSIISSTTSDSSSEGLVGSQEPLQSTVAATGIAVDSSRNTEASRKVLTAAADIWTTWKVRRKRGEEFVAKHCIDYILYNSPPTLSDRNVIDSTSSSGSMVALAVSEIFDDASVPQELFPSHSYPSDHIAVVADLQLLHHPAATEIEAATE